MVVREFNMNENIIISLTSIPRRFDFLEKQGLPILIDTLIQSNSKILADGLNYKISEILISVDDNLNEDDFKKYFSLKNLISSDIKISIQKIDSRFKCIAKESGPIIKYGHNVSFITVDDDQIYNDSNKFYDLIKFHDKFLNDTISIEANPAITDGVSINILNTLVFKISALRSYSKFLSNFCLFPKGCFTDTKLLDVDYIVKENWNRHDELFCWAELTKKGVKNVTLNNTYSLAWDNFDSDFTSDKNGLRDYNSIHWNDWTSKINLLYKDIIKKINYETYEFIIEDKNAFGVNLLYRCGLINKMCYNKKIIFNTEMLNSKSYEKFCFRKI